MTTDEANKIISEYMGDISFESIGTSGDNHMSDQGEIFFKDKYCSLDNLVSVWEKMKTGMNIEYNPKGVFLDEQYFYSTEVVYKIERIGKYSSRTYTGDHASNNIQESAAIATAKAIQELK